MSAFSPTLLWTTEGCCTAPLSITATAVDTMGATIAWTTVLASNAYDLRYRVLGTFPWTELDGLSGNNTTISGLAPCSDIEVQMRSTCDGTTADWSTSTALHVPGCGQCVEGVFCTSRGSSAATVGAGLALMPRALADSLMNLSGDPLDDLMKALI